jgi:peptide deformylase
MIRDIVMDTEVLTQVSTKVDPKAEYTKQVIQDLLDTANHYKDRCVGLAAIQIGEPVRIVVVFDGKEFVPLVNPVITRTIGKKYYVEEGCMSLNGKREVARFEGVEVIYQTTKGKGFAKLRCHGYAAQIVQHEVDHLNGKLI